MTTYELRRIAQMYGATEAEVREAEHTAVRIPMVPLGRVLHDVMLTTIERLTEEPPDAMP